MYPCTVLAITTEQRNTMQMLHTALLKASDVYVSNFHFCTMLLGSYIAQAALDTANK